MTMTEVYQPSIGVGSDSMLPKNSGAGWCERACRALRKLTLVSDRHPRTFEHIRSYPVMVAERQRQVLEGDALLIHPFSLFSMYWNNMMVLVNLAHMVVSSMRLCYFLEPIDQPNESDYVLLVLHVVCLADILVKFNTGYLEGKPGVVVLDRRVIACHYLRFAWLDLLSCLPLSFLLLSRKYHAHHCVECLITHSLPLCRAARLFTVLRDLRVLVRKLTRSHICLRVIQHLIAFALLVHWFSCLVYLPPAVHYYWTGVIPPGHSRFVPANRSVTVNLTQLAVGERYAMGLFIVLSAFFGTGFSVFVATQPSEILLNAVIILGATMFMIFTAVFYLNLYMTAYNSSMRYQELMNQVEKYMRHKQFPAPLKKRVLAFYHYRYQERYFKEETAFVCLSEQLRHEIALHTCQNLVKKVTLFEGLPSTLVGALLGCLKPEVYLPNDLIVRAGDFGDCMYFVSSGTVAVYSIKGLEICHMEDGDYFGTLALLNKDRKRCSTVVAIEITHVYRLDYDDFRHFIMTNQELSDRLEAHAARCTTEAALLNLACQRERRQELHSRDLLN